MDIDTFPWWTFCGWAAFISNMTVAKKTGFAPWQLRRTSPTIDLPHLLTNIELTLQKSDFHHTDYFEFLEIQQHSLKSIKKIAKANWNKYVTDKAHLYWRKLTKRQQKQLQQRPLKVGSKVMVRSGSKTGISPNKLITRKSGPWTVIGLAVNNNAYKLKNDITGQIQYVGLRRIRLIKPSHLDPIGNLQDTNEIKPSINPPSSSPNDDEAPT